MAYTTINKHTDCFNTVTFTGTGSAGTSTGVGFTPDMFIHKNRDNNQGWGVIDVIRGNGNLFWAESTNIAVKQAIGDGATHVMTMNDDTTLDINFMKQMLKVSRRFPAALVGCLAVDSESTKPLYAGIKMDWKKPK